MTASEESTGTMDAPSSHEFVEKTQEAVEELKENMQRTGENLKHQAEEQTRSHLNKEKEWIAQRIDKTAQSLRDASKNLTEQELDPMARFSDGMAVCLENASNYLKEKSIGEITEDLEHLAKQRPFLFLVGAFTTGFIASRFIKASSLPK